MPIYQNKFKNLFKHFDTFIDDLSYGFVLFLIGLFFFLEKRVNQK